MSWRKMLLTLFAAVVVGTTAAPNPASARRGFRGGGRGFGRGWVGPAVGLGLGLGLAAGYPYYYGGYPYGAHYGYGHGCWRRAVVDTPWGPRVRRIWVCD
jgi:hypothetical protein